ncbi:MAG: DNA-protecting protein DprA [Solirubrobacterales bacterium]|nr:DNA-protecting protein DprA [Solirubrobacterales bacterium]
MSFLGTPRACGRCLKRSWLLARLSGNLDLERRRLTELLALPDRELVHALAGRQRKPVLAEYGDLDSSALRACAGQAGLEVICACDGDYPAGLRELENAPAALYVAGGLERFLDLISRDAVAVVGARRASEYGLQVARSLARGITRAGLTVASGMATGIDSAGHVGALETGDATVAVLPAGADHPYPPGKRALYRRITARGAAVSELPPSTPARRWMFPARNRIIAALSAAVIVVEAGERSGALVTAKCARELGRAVGAVPGRVTSPLAAGPNHLIAQGALLVRGAQDVLELLFGDGAGAAVSDDREALSPEDQRLVQAIGEGLDTIGALVRAGLAPDEALASLSALELTGYVRRATGGRYELLP